MSLHIAIVLKAAEHITNFIKKRPALKAFMDWHTEMQWRWMGHYKLGTLCVYSLVGLRSDDILSDGSEVVQEAIKRLSDQELFDRTFRIRRAMQLQLTNSTLPESEWVKFEEVSVCI